MESDGRGEFSYRLTLTCLPEETLISRVSDELVRDGLAPERERGDVARALTSGFACEIGDETRAKQAYVKYRKMGCAVEVKKIPASAPPSPPEAPAPSRPDPPPMPAARQTSRPSVVRGRVGRIMQRACPSCGVSIPVHARVCPHCRHEVMRPRLPRMLKSLALVLVLAGVAYIGVREPEVPTSPLDIAHVGGAWNACIDRARAGIAGGEGAVYPPMPDRARGEVFYRLNSFVAHEGNYRYSIQGYAQFPGGKRETFRCKVVFDLPGEAGETIRVMEFGAK